MKTKAIRLHGANDIRLEEFDLPEITEEEVLIRVVSDSVCASTYKAIKQGTAHKRVPNDIDENPVIIGHEMCGEIIQVGDKLTDTWQVGQKIVVQPALKLPSGYDPGYSYPYIGGNTQYAVVPKVVLERGCLLPYEGESFFEGSLVESLGCCIRGFKGFYHTDYTTYIRTDGAKARGQLVRAGCQHRRQSCQIIRRKADQSAAPRHAVHKASHERQGTHDQEHLPGNLHG